VLRVLVTEGPLSATVLAMRTDRAQHSVSKHLQVLRAVGAVVMWRARTATDENSFTRSSRAVCVMGQRVFAWRNDPKCRKPLDFDENTVCLNAKNQTTIKMYGQKATVGCPAKRSQRRPTLIGRKPDKRSIGTQGGCMGSSEFFKSCQGRTAPSKNLRED
jgi:hypothetical protein